MTVVREPSSHNRAVLYVDGPLRAPVNGELRHRVRPLLRGGQRNIVVDLARVSRIDAAGVGELVRAYNMAIAVCGVLQIVHATRWVREILERAGLFDLLSGDWEGDERGRGEQFLAELARDDRGKLRAASG